MRPPNLAISEMFYSLQGEGPSVGTPAVFLRLQGCNLNCGEILKGGLEPESPATWRCDTLDVWRNGKPYTPETVLTLWRHNGWIHALENHAILVITGGEPLLQDRGITELLHVLKNNIKSPVRTEIETNGTILPSATLEEYTIQYNVSPKLKNSGMTQKKRWVVLALKYFSTHPNSIFKLVISELDDIHEIENCLLRPFGIPKHKIVLMPAADSQKDIAVIGPKLAALCIKKGYRYTPRLHIDLWNQKTGV